MRSIKIETNAARAGIAAGILLCLIGGYFFAKWGFANTISTRTELREVSDLAVALAPSDPQTHFAAAVLSEQSFLPEDFAKSLAEYEQAAALSPNDYLLWLALGKARSRAGDLEGAEKALRKSLELAPNYAQLHWTLGNILLREDKTDEAFAEMRRAAEGDEAKYAEPVVVAASQKFGGDIEQIKRAVGTSPKTKATLVVYLARLKRFDEAFDIWNTLSEDEKRTTHRQNSDELYNQLMAAKMFRPAAQVYAQLNAADRQLPSVGQLNDGGFEGDIKNRNAAAFEWQIGEGINPQIGLNSAQKHGGNQSLFIVLDSQDGRDFRTISQTVAVEGGKTYQFEGFYKSELKASATFRWEIADAADGRVLASTDATAATADWTKISASFTVAPSSEAVVIRLARVACNSLICPILGKIWFDDFALKQ